ncbi:MAG: hypothetical protein HY537_01655, partial [Deltaproteobacteria bacterium]|nr:hypothetical protein [Deltaproteobacteria bacterium]
GGKYARSFLKTLAQKWVYFVFLILIIMPLVGHGFFSPGWLYFPGIIISFILALCVSSLHLPVPRRSYFQLACMVMFVTYLPVLFRLTEVGWWQWSKGQKQILDIVRSVPGHSITELVIYDCDNPAYPAATLRRVVGFEASFYELWKVVHGETVKISILRCSKQDRIPASAVGKQLSVRWQFPEFKVLDPSNLLRRD